MRATPTRRGAHPNRVTVGGRNGAVHRGAASNLVPYLLVSEKGNLGRMGRPGALAAGHGDVPV
jgi:hypothetical protein